MATLQFIRWEKISLSVRTGELTIFAEIENENIFHFHFWRMVRTGLKTEFGERFISSEE
jgi:hypothetical protein